jgi:predicted MFS family arabinose efflux permease
MTTPASERKRSSRRLKTRLIISAIFLLILALAFNALLSTSTLEKLYVESIVSSYQVIGRDLQRNLEKSLRYGKKIEKFVGMSALMEDTLRYMTYQDSPGMGKDLSPGPGSPSGSDRYVAVALPDHKILYSTNEGLLEKALPEKARIDYGEKGFEGKAPKEIRFVKDQNTYLVPLPIRDRKKVWIATAFLAFDDTQVKQLLNSAVRKNVRIGIIILACGAVLLLIILNLMLPRERAKLRAKLSRGPASPKDDRPPQFPKGKISVALFVVITLSQIVFSTFSTMDFEAYYLKITKEKSITLNTLLKEDIEYLLSKGLQLQKLFKMEVMMGEILAALPEVSDITILSRDENPLYTANKKGVVNFSKDPGGLGPGAIKGLALSGGEYNVRINIEKKGAIEGYLSTNISKDVVLSKLREIIYDCGTVLVISILFFIELLIMIFQFLEKDTMEAARQKKLNYRAVRPAAFLFLFGIDISISFLPLHMAKLYEPIFGLSKDMVMGLPISVEMFFAAISLFIAGAWLDRRGWHEPFLTGLFLTGIGILYSWLAPDAIHFIVSRGLVGLGYGFSLMASQGFVIAQTDETNKTLGLALLFAGVYAGSICGGAAGAMLADRIGFGPVFLIGAVIVFLVIFYTLIFMRGAIQKIEPLVAVKQAESVSIGKLFRYLFNVNIFSLIIFNSLPAAMAIVGFLNYFSPVYLNRIGESQSNIGRVYMIYGVCLIYLAPFVSKYIDVSKSKKKYVVLSGFIGSLAFITFYFFGGVAATAATVLLLGLSGSFSAARRAYALKLKITNELGQGKAMGIFDSATRFGQVLGPIIFGWMLVSVGISKGITYFGVVYFLATLLFLLFAQSDRTPALPEEKTT